MRTCLIVGGGLTGLLAAWELARAGLKVTLLERGALGRESSWAGGGILSPMNPWRYPDPVTALAGWSQQVYPGLLNELHQISGVDPQYRRSGLLIVTQGEWDTALSWAAFHDIEMHSIAAGEIAEIEPAYGGSAERALWMPSVGQLRNPWMLRALVGACKAKGVEFVEATEVCGFDLRGGRVVGALTAGVRFPADLVVVAGGAWSRQILGDLDCGLEIEPVKGQMLLYKTDPGLFERIILDDGHYVIPRRDGYILAGSTVESCGYDKSTTEEAFVELQKAAESLVPAMAGVTVEKQWAGLRPGSPNGVPYIGRHPEVENLFVSAGHFRNGVVMGPASARLLSDMILERTPVIDPEPYRIGR